MAPRIHRRLAVVVAAADASLQAPVEPSKVNLGG